MAIAGRLVLDPGAWLSSSTDIAARLSRIISSWSFNDEAIGTEGDAMVLDDDATGSMVSSPMSTSKRFDDEAISTKEAAMVLDDEATGSMVSSLMSTSNPSANNLLVKREK